MGGAFSPTNTKGGKTMASMERKILRNIAKVQMEKEKIPHPCRKHITKRGERKESFFKRYWKEYAQERINSLKNKKRRK